MKEEKKCNCKDDCTCGCKEGKECTCTDEKCNCGCNEEKCNCKEDNCECGCQDGKECTCDCNDKKEKKGIFKDKGKKDKKKIEELETKVKKLEEDVLVAKADLVNYRKRKDEEVTRMLKFCNEDLIKQLLPVLDNFERAIKLDDNNLNDEVSKFLEGFKMIYCNMENIMANFEVKPIDGNNKPFDPVYHNAILTEHVEGVEPGIVLDVMQRGYLYKDKVVRPAMVKVSE